MYYKDYKNNKILFSQPLEITAINVIIEAPEAVKIESEFDVTWDGPGNRSDAIGIKKSGKKGKRIYFQRINHDDPDERTVTLKAPKKAGSYELFYRDYKNNALLATKTIEVTN